MNRLRVFEKSGASVFEMPRSARHDKGHSERNPCHSEPKARNLGIGSNLGYNT